MNLDIEKLKQIVESEGCTLIKSFQSGYLMAAYCIMLPDSFPWYGVDFDKERIKQSRIIARIEIHNQDCIWTVWSEPVIHTCPNKPPLGIEMVDNGSREEPLLKNYSYEQIAAWLQSKIGEVSKKAKECRKLTLAYQSKEYEA